MNGMRQSKQGFLSLKCGSSHVVFQGMKVFFLIVVAIYILYLIFLIVRACSELKNMPYSGTTAQDAYLYAIHCSH